MRLSTNPYRPAHGVLVASRGMQPGRLARIDSAWRAGPSTQSTASAGDQPDAPDRVGAEVQASTRAKHDRAQRKRRPLGAVVRGLAAGVRVALRDKRLRVARAHAAFGLRLRIGSQEPVHASGEQEDDEVSIAHVTDAAGAATTRLAKMGGTADLVVVLAERLSRRAVAALCSAESRAYVGFGVAQPEPAE